MLKSGSGDRPRPFVLTYPDQGNGTVTERGVAVCVGVLGDFPQRTNGNLLCANANSVQIDSDQLQSGVGHKLPRTATFGWPTLCCTIDSELELRLSFNRSMISIRHELSNKSIRCADCLRGEIESVPVAERRRDKPSQEHRKS